jgi:hypothetical protein
MSRKLDELHLAAWRNFITAHARLIARIDQELADAGCVPLHWYDVLIELAEAPEGRLRMSELARKGSERPAQPGTHTYRWPGRIRSFNGGG